MGSLRFLWDVIQKSALIFTVCTSFPRRETLLTFLKLKCTQAVFSKILKRPITSASIFGFRVHFFDFAMFLYLFEEVFLKQEYYFVSDVPNPVIFDCGSNIGLALLYFKKLYPQSTIVAFEPDRTTYAVLQDNVRLNNLTNVHAHNNALSGTEGTIEFYNDPNQPGWPRMSIQKERMSGTSETIESVTLSRFIDRKIDFVKMDIEGAEYAVIEELASRRKLNSVNEFVIEYHHHMNPDIDNLSAMLRVFEDNGMGYQIAGTATGFLKNCAPQDILIRAYGKR